MTSPNIILLTVDTLRADVVGNNARAESVTPNIDKLAASGVQFQQAITGGSWTQAAFPPILTSTYASMYGGCLGPLASTRPSPVEVLAAHGFTSAAFSTSPLLSQKYAYHRGFSSFTDLVPEETDVFLRRLRGGQRLLRHPLTHRVLGFFGQRSRPAALYVSGKKLSEAVCTWIEETQEPFFVWAHYMDVHWPYHREDRLSDPAAIAQMWDDLGHMHGVNWGSLQMTEERHDHYMALYREAVASVDAQIGLLLDRLAETGRLANTVVVLVSDHGEEFMERRHWGHFETNLYDEVLRIPLIVSGVNIPAGQVVEQQVSTFDIMPTVLALCNCPPPAEMEGQSLAALWRPEAGGYDKEHEISEMWRSHRHIVAVRTSEFKYIWDSDVPDEPLLYHLVADPRELENVYRLHPQVARHFQSVVDGHLERIVAQDAEEVLEVEPDAALVHRLRALGYVE